MRQVHTWHAVATTVAAGQTLEMPPGGIRPVLAAIAE
jgi:uncharacterized protein (DUF2062 family)